MTELDALAIPVLTAAGWHPGRSVGPKSVREQYVAGGFDPPPCVLEFMDEFGGLKFDIPHPKLGPAVRYPCWFLLRFAVEYDREWIADWERIAGTELTPLGLAGSGPFAVCMASDDRVFQAYENIVQHVGIDGVDAINGYLRQREPIWTRLGDPG